MGICKSQRCSAAGSRGYLHQLALLHFVSAMPAAAYGRFCILLSCALAFTALSFPPEIAAAYDSPLEAGFLATNDRSLLDTNMVSSLLGCVNADAATTASKQ